MWQNAACFVLREIAHEIIIDFGTAQEITHEIIIDFGTAQEIAHEITIDFGTAQATGWTVWISNPGRKNFPLPPKRPDLFWGSHWPPFNVYPGCAEGVNRPGRDVGGSPSSVDVKN